MSVAFFVFHWSHDRVEYPGESSQLNFGQADIVCFVVDDADFYGIRIQVNVAVAVPASLLRWRYNGPASWVSTVSR